MGESFTLKVYNHSSSEIDFEIKNIQCMNMPSNRRIKLPPYSWGEFDALEASNNVWRGCFFSHSKFNISAYRNSKTIGNTTYRVYDTFRCRFFGFKESIMVKNKSLLGGPGVHSLVFERVDSYGDLFFNGRGMYVENTVKSSLEGESIGSTKMLEIDEMLPTSLVNSNRQLISEVDDSSLINVVSRWASLGLRISEVYSFAKKLDYGPKPAASDLKIAWDQFKDTLGGYYSLYKSAISDSDELTIHVRDVRDIVDSPAFHLVFTDSTDKAEEIMIGNFYLPPPPNSNNTFYQNILHLSEEAYRMKNS